MLEGRRRQSPAARRSHHQLAPQQEWLDLVDKRVWREVHGMGDRFDANRPAAEHAGDSFQILAVLLIEAQGVDPLHFQGIAGDRQADAAIGPGQGVVADPAEAVVGQSRRAAAAPGDLVGGPVGDLDPQLGRIAADDLESSSIV